MHETHAAWTGSIQWAAFLATTLFIVGISQAWIALSATFYIVKATWPRPLQPAMESAGALLVPAILMLLVLVLGGRHGLFYWTAGHAEGYWYSIPHMAFRTLVLNAAVYLLGLGLFFKADKLGETPRRVLSAFTLIFFFAAQTILSWDFGTNLQPHWHPSVFPPFQIISNLQAGTAAAILTFAFLRGSALGPKLQVQQFDLLGQLLLGFTFLWIYTGFSLYLVIWYGNLPYEVAPMDLRIWHWAPGLFWTMMAVKLFIPFFCLINTQLRRTAGALSFVALLILSGTFIERYLIVAPAVHPHPVHFSNGILLRHAAIVVAALVVGIASWRIFIRRRRVLETTA
ncbi:MAG: hypothetical protein HYY13_02730 [Nitrospirae bacterium]|nr:hypothetical protein [Nitrospirota bacterium]